jgi:hypothetical protein
VRKGLAYCKGPPLPRLSNRYHFIALTGKGEAWAVIYYIFAFMKGVASKTVRVAV